MPPDNRSPRLTAQDVLRRYKEECLLAFCEIPLEDVNPVGNFSERPIHVACVRGSLEEIAALLDGGADLDAAGTMGTDHCMKPSAKVISKSSRFLVDHGAPL